jgi:hypothetical protein
MMENWELLEGIYRHFIIGCRELTAIDFTEHQKHGSCAACRQLAREVSENTVPAAAGR